MSPEPSQSMGIGKKVEPPAPEAGPVRKHLHGHIYEVDGKLVNEQPTPKTPAQDFFDLFVKQVGGLC